MKPILFLSIILLFYQTASSQISATGIERYKWGTAKSSVKALVNCSTSDAGAGFENCQVSVPDSLFLGKYKYSFFNLRFYKGKLSEINIDLKHKDLASLVSELTVKFGKPAIKENTVSFDETQEDMIGYEWITGDTKLLILNKGTYNPVWCTFSSISMKKTIPTEKDLGKLIFE
jgi:hypothetical protein